MALARKPRAVDELMTQVMTTRILIAGCFIALVITTIVLLVRRPMPVRHVIFISLDTTRADHLGCYGSPWVDTPNLDRIARDSLLFDNFISVSSTTLASHTSMFTGRYPRHHGTPANGYLVDEDNVMLPEVLRAKGFTTWGFIGAFPLSRWYHFPQGFDYYDEHFDQNVNPKRIERAQRDARKVTDAVIRHVTSKGIPEHLFLFVHYYDPHNPYQPPGELVASYDATAEKIPWPAQTLADAPVPTSRDLEKARRYAGEISFVDHQLGRLLDFLSARGILDDALLVVTSDHGENMFWDPNPFSHGWDTSDAVMRAICLLRTPDTLNNGAKVHQLVASIDLLPSIVTYLGFNDGIEDSDGEAVDFTGAPDRDPGYHVFGECTKPNREDSPRLWRNRMNIHCIYSDRWKLVLHPSSGEKELFNLENDPRETTNMIGSSDPDAAAVERLLSRQISDWMASTRPRPSRLQSTDSTQAVEKLKSLGYF